MMARYVRRHQASARELTQATCPDPYDAVAKEYYDASRHPACSCLRAASEQYIVRALDSLATAEGTLCEVGPGRSVLAEWLAGRRLALDRLLLVDSSERMLAHANKWAVMGASVIHGGAFSLPTRDESIALLVSSLGDPYNEPPFWSEVSRTLRAGGYMVFTVPAMAWVGGSHRRLSAEFELADGRVVTIPSVVRPVVEQAKLIERNRLEILNSSDVLVSSLAAGPLSEWLLSRHAAHSAVVTGYTIRKP